MINILHLHEMIEKTNEIHRTHDEHPASTRDESAKTAMTSKDYLTS